MAPQIVRLWESVLQDVSALAAHQDRGPEVSAAKRLQQLKTKYDQIQKQPWQEAHLKQVVRTVQVRLDLHIPAGAQSGLACLPGVRIKSWTDSLQNLG
jgi:hypothetical protein